MRPDCLIKLESLLRSLNEAERKAADFILANQARILELSISEVAAGSGVSESTVFRLCRALDYSGFRDFKMSLTRQDSLPMNQVHVPVADTDTAHVIANKVFNLTIGSLQDSLRVLDFDELERACATIEKARKVLVIGLGGSRTTAIFAADKLSFLGIESNAEVDIHSQVRRAALLGPEDAVLAFSRSGDTRDLIEAVIIAKEHGAATIGVGNNPRSYFIKTVDIKLILKSLDTRFRDDLLASRIEHISLVDVIYSILAVRDKDRASALHKMLLEVSNIKQF